MRLRIGQYLIVLVALLVMVFALSGCARTVPQEVTDVNRALQNAKDACATVYAVDELGGVQSGVDSMNALADDRKYRKARKEAEPLAPQVTGLNAHAASARNAAKQKAEEAIETADSALGQARDAGAVEHASKFFGDAEAKLSAAKSAAKDPCRYDEATALAAEGRHGAQRAAAEAADEKARLEEQRRREEEERLRAEEERRRAEEERLRRFPPTYTVQQGDSLWRIAGMETVYGNPTYWPLLYQANESSISDPNLIYPGLELTLPRDMDEAQMDAALRNMWRSMASAAEE